MGSSAHRPQRARRAVVLAAAVAAILAAAGLRMTQHGPPDDTAAPVALALAPVRAIEGRLSYATADRYRPYHVPRAGGVPPPAERIGFEQLAELERRGDLHGVAVASLLRGDSLHAADYLGRAAPSLDVDADRALIQLSDGHPREALIALDRVLDAAPRHPQALWNRALALRDLGLALAAAEAFEAVAALHEPGWADEARAHAQQLADEVRDRRAAFQRLALEAGPRLATAGDAIAPDLARRFPGMARLRFYDGVRAATSAAAVRALAPLAHTLDELQGGTALTAYVDRIARADFAVRAPLARRYAELVAGGRLDDAAAARFLAALRGARADDILLGALVVTAPDGHVDAARIPELRRLVDATGDPWFHLLALERAADALIQAGDHAAAEPLALAALTTCDATRLDYRCAALALTLADSYHLTNRLSDAQRLLDASVGRARRGGEWYLENRFLVLFAQVATLGDDVAGSTLPVARAYLRELTLREPQRCDIAAWGSDLIALLFVNRVDLAGARTELARADAILAACPAAAPDGELTRSVEHLFATAHVLRDPSAGPEEVARARRQIAHARDTAAPGTQTMLDHIEGRLTIDRDRAGGTALLERAITRADALTRGEVNATRARAYAYSLLALDAGRAGEWDRLWELLGRAARAPVPRRCAIGVAVEDGARVVVVRDPDGASHGAFAAAAPGRAASPAIDAAQLVSPALGDALRGCPEVDVLARPPVQGLPELLPTAVAWSYHLDETAPGGAGAAATDPSARARRVVIANAQPPTSLGLAPLSPWRSTEAPDLRLEGAQATPSRALAELASATFVEIHTHGVVDASGTDASFLTLSPDSDGRYTLSAAAIRRQPLRGRPVVILAACHAASTATYRHEAWSLPAAFLAAGARAVIASTDIIDDDAAGALFDDVRTRIERGASPATALRDARLAALARNPGAAWLRGLMVFH